MNIHKIAITGHSRGIGKATYDHLSQQYQVVGFSRSNGYDISLEADIDRILTETMDCDIFINNAYHFDQQLVIAEKWNQLHLDKDHFIINVSSLASDPIFDIKNKIPHLVPYADEKHKLNQKTFDICDQRNRKCKAMSLLLGIVETGFVNPYGSDPDNLYEHYLDFKDRGVLIQPSDVAVSINTMIDSIKNNSFIYSISLLNRF